MRKVKCDEGYPACRRCLSTGRTCDGYGIWGGGSSNKPTKLSAVIVNSAVIIRPMSDFRLFTRTRNEEGRYLQWFRERTGSKMSGSFFSEFWSGFVLQASMSEPAVLHRGRGKGNIDPLYSHCLRFVHRARAAQRPFRIGANPSSTGLKPPRSVRSIERKGHLLVGPSHQYIDDWIVQALSGLHIQLEPLKQVHRGSSLRLQIPFLECKSSTFPSLKEAWSWLHHLMGTVFQLNGEVREQLCQDSSLRAELLQRQRSLHENFTQWLNTYNTTIQTMKGRMPKDQVQIYGLLRLYHIMITIMAATCLYPDNEMVFDLHTDQFLEMITMLADLWRFLSICSASGSQPAQFYMSRSIGDMAWIAALYYTAIKCRVHRIRLHAIRLLETSFHREGLWDSQILSFVARKVMEIEQGNFYQLLGAVDDFQLHRPPGHEDILFPPLPESCRLPDVEPTEQIAKSVL
ncbi:hypothetical protein CNMCM6106_001146 [Aspergillus hiratsukae]|uniref:Zn(2)-C6 fungal-type domain-containing protein n=1 Tax=Aspergillus hiratsukae TaxID=1194566 RepID=A0A8H6Q2Q3_9EURO|nr:hypothetical protein CNMCM6106_001146 [Aspergillus hiratsukae]